MFLCLSVKSYLKELQTAYFQLRQEIIHLRTFTDFLQFKPFFSQPKVKIFNIFLKMHKAYVLHQPSKISVQIESIAGYKNIVFLGTRF